MERGRKLLRVAEGIRTYSDQVPNQKWAAAIPHPPLMQSHHKRCSYSLCGFLISWLWLSKSSELLNGPYDSDRNGFNHWTLFQLLMAVCYCCHHPPPQNKWSCCLRGGDTFGWITTTEKDSRRFVSSAVKSCIPEIHTQSILLQQVWLYQSPATCRELWQNGSSSTQRILCT